MRLNFDAAKPIYEQIIDQIKKTMVRGELKPGDKLPSQREMARKLEVNPNTIQRAYREMEVLELVETRRGKGTFIKEDDSMVTAIKSEMARNATDRFIQEMRSLDYNTEQILDWIKEQTAEKEVGK